MFVDRVDAVDRDAGFTALASPDGDARVAGLGGVEGAAFVDFNAGFQARQLNVQPPSSGWALASASSACESSASELSRPRS